MTDVDVIVVGGGHAGCEAALACARLGKKTVLIVQDLSRLAYMPCNPSIGGPAKGHLTREISALGGFQAQAADQSALMIRWLNTSKGSAVRALRAQCDLDEFSALYRQKLDQQENLRLYQDEVVRLLISGEKVVGVVTRFGIEIRSQTVILTTGTHLGGRVHLGLTNFSSGPMGQAPSLILAQQLTDMNLLSLRLKTGTPPRLDGTTIDWSSIERQEGDLTPCAFDFWSEPQVVRQRWCGLIRTNSKTHDLVRQFLDQSPLDQGVITGIGPRYCPSIESKVTAFPQKDSHPLFLEPTTRHGQEIYVQNFSTSLPMEAQILMVHSLPGLENAHIIKPGYAIEYLAIDARNLHPWLEHRQIQGLFFAGQINGTSGYEEAGAQGLLAGANAALKCDGREPLVLRRDQAYLGVLIDDLITKGTEEPYRMLTSRCEHRLLLRHDNADRRLCQQAFQIGLLSKEKYDQVQRRWDREDRLFYYWSDLKISSEQVDRILGEGASSGRGIRAKDLLSRPEVTWSQLEDQELDFTAEEKDHVEIRIKYEGYVQRQLKAVERMNRLEDLKIPSDFDYRQLKGALTESLEKLQQIRPATFGQATRIPGVSAEDLQTLAMLLRRSHHDRSL